MDDWINQLSQIALASKNNAPFTLYVVAIFWGVHIVNMLLGMRLNILGIHPRTPFGLIGIPCSPFLHGNFEHIFFNSVPLFILVNLMLMFGLHTFYVVSIGIILVGGLAVWLFGRRAIHIGASGLIMGYWGFLLVTAVYLQSVLSVIVGALCLYYLGGLFLNLLPRGKGISWEAHLFGFLAGIGMVYALPFVNTISLP